MIRALKSMSKKQRQQFICAFVAIIVSGVLLVYSISHITLGWFSHNSQIHGMGMDVVVHNDSYDLLVMRSSEIYSDAVYDGVDLLRAHLTSEGYGLIDQSTVGDYSRLAFELNNDDVDAQTGKRNLQPGSYGSLTFFVKPHNGTEITIEFLIDIKGYHLDYEDSSGLLNGINELNSVSVHNYLKGHMLFFKEKTGDNYDGLITDGHFTFDSSDSILITSDGITSGCYEVTLYWVWPITYEDIDSNTPQSDLGAEKYPFELRQYIEDNKNFFFATHLESDDPVELGDGYNDADQEIGMNVDFLVVCITG